MSSIIDNPKYEWLQQQLDKILEDYSYDEDKIIWRIRELLEKNCFAPLQHFVESYPKEKPLIDEFINCLVIKAEGYVQAKLAK